MQNTSHLLPYFVNNAPPVSEQISAAHMVAASPFVVAKSVTVKKIPFQSKISLAVMY